jgi:thiamine biosynthesis lipoprotein
MSLRLPLNRRLQGAVSNELLRMIPSRETGKPLRLEKCADSMRATYSVVLYGNDMSKMAEAVDAAFREVQRLDQLLSIYRAESEWSRINCNAAQNAVPVSPESLRLLSICLEYGRLSQGSFDISIGPLMKLWGFFKGAGCLPSQPEIHAVLPLVGHQKIHLDPETRSVRFAQAGMEIDPGGIGKGYAIDCMVDILRQRGFVNALLSAAGSSIYAMGAPPADRRGWQVDICDPRHPRKTATEVFLRDCSISTSGGYAQTFWAEGRLHSHILDPRTGNPARGMALVSVVAARAIESEAWCKPCYINGRLWSAVHKPKEVRVFFYEEGPKTPSGWLG